MQTNLSKKKCRKQTVAEHRVRSQTTATSDSGSIFLIKINKLVPSGGHGTRRVV